MTKKDAAGKRAKTGGGNRKGKPNVFNNCLKKDIISAFYRAGGVDWLVEQAHSNPVAFLGLLAKIIPKEVHGELNHNQVQISRIELVPITPENDSDIKRIISTENTKSSNVLDISDFKVVGK
jgi:hypothetical protein